MENRSVSQAADTSAPETGRRMPRRWVVILCVAGVALAVGTVFLLTKKDYSLETKTVVAMHAYVEAQQQYAKAHRDGSGKAVFADQLAKLRDFLPAKFIAAHGPNGKPYNGYLFLEMKKFSDGTVIDWVNDFGMCAVPAKYGRTGYRTFIVGTNGTIFGADLGPTIRFVDIYPNNPSLPSEYGPPWCLGID